MSFRLRPGPLSLGLFAVTLVPAPAGPDAAPASATATNVVAAPAPPQATMRRPPAVARPPLYRDTTVYPPLTLTWNTRTDLSQVLGVFPHPILPRRVVLTTPTGVLLSDDAGQTWTNFAGASADRVGVINAVAFDPVATDTFYLGSASGGIWMTSDAGKTFTQVGSKAKGLASDTVTDLIVYPGDPTHQTLLAVHGDAAPGLSSSPDRGQTWDVVDTDYHFHRLTGGEGDMTVVYLIGSTLKEPDIQSLYMCTTVGEFVIEVVRDIVPTDMNFAPVAYEKSGLLYLATSDSGLHLVPAPDRGGYVNDPKQLGSKDDTWSSVSVTWGPSADALNLYLYDSSKLGLVMSNDDLATQQMAGNGAPVGALIKEGAVVRPNANGTVFYASANDSLSIGRQPEDVPDVTVSPATFELDPRAKNGWREIETAFAAFNSAKGSTLAAAQAFCKTVGDPQALYRQHVITVTARLPLKPAPPTAVTVDLSRYGGPPDMPLFDDGKHDDAAAGDGVYGGTFAFLPELHRPRGGDPETRSVWPGRVAIGVRATFADGHHQGAVGVIGIYAKTADITFWSSNPESVGVKAVGPVTAEAAPNPEQIHNGIMAMRADTQAGMWSVEIRAPYNQRDISGYEAVSLSIRLSDGTPPKELYLQLADHPELSAPTTTARVPILNGKTLGADYFRVVVPMKTLIGQATQFQLNKFDKIILSGDTTAPATLFVDGVQVLARYDEPGAPTNTAPPAK